MNYTIIKKLPSVETIIQNIPLSSDGYKRVAQDRKEIKAILSGKDKRLLLIVGPCSAWPQAAVLDYARRLASLNEKIRGAIKLVMRVYTQKPRTTKGWTGLINQPDPYSPPDIEKGMKYARETMVKVIDMGLPIADEALYIHNADYFLPLLSWVAIGARSSENQAYRVFASAIDCAVGIKNATHGSLIVATNSVLAAQHRYVTAFNNHEVQTQGNPYAHIVLRGSDGKANYSIAHLETVRSRMNEQQITNPAIIIDVSHDNCRVGNRKDYRLQPNTIFNILNAIKSYPSLKPLVKGFMVESFIKAGNQKLDANNLSDLDLDGLSITDPCLGWEETENMILKLATLLNA